MQTALRNIRVVRGGGFTLAEIMFAIVILGVGLTMAAALFPAAMEFHQSSSTQQIGGIAAENGLAIAGTSLHHPLGTGSSLADVTSKLGPAERKYPFSINGPRGCVVLARQMRSGVNDYLVVVVGYTKSDAGASVNAASLSGVTVPAGATTFTVQSGQAAGVETGGVIVGPDGSYATVAGVDGTRVELESPLSRKNDVSNPVSVYESGDGTLLGTIVRTSRMALGH